jgi:uncharacterized surface protein with fasciclin (FAS1) repeats
MNIKAKALRTAGAALAALALSAAPAFAADSAPATGSVLDIASQSPDFSTFVAAVKAAGLTDELSAPGPITVFAPTNEAFAKLPADQLAALMKPENKAQLREVLEAHVVAQAVPFHEASGDIDSGSVTALDGTELDFGRTGDTTTVDGAKLERTDIKAANGYLDGIDNVIMPKGMNALQ